METLISQSISKAVPRWNRPRWVRTTDLDEDGKLIVQDVEVIENGIHLNVHSIDIVDAENGIDYKDVTGKLIHADKEEVKPMWHVYENSFPLPDGYG